MPVSHRRETSLYFFLYSGLLGSSGFGFGVGVAAAAFGATGVLGFGGLRVCLGAFDFVDEAGWLKMGLGTVAFLTGLGVVEDFAGAAYVREAGTRGRESRRRGL